LLITFGGSTLSSAEVESFRIGDAANWIFDVIGFVFLDSLTATPNLIYVLGISAIVLLLYRAWKTKI